MNKEIDTVQYQLWDDKITVVQSQGPVRLFANIHHGVICQLHFITEGRESNIKDFVMRRVTPLELLIESQTYEEMLTLIFTGSSLPPSIRIRLYELFVQIEREFEILYTENLGLQDRVEWLTDSQSNQQLSNQPTSHLQNNRYGQIDNYDGESGLLDFSFYR